MKVGKNTKLVLSLMCFYSLLTALTHPTSNLDTVFYNVFVSASEQGVVVELSLDPNRDGVQLPGTEMQTVRTLHSSIRNLDEQVGAILNLVITDLENFVDPVPDIKPQFKDLVQQLMRVVGDTDYFPYISLAFGGVNSPELKIDNKTVSPPDESEK